MDKKKASQTTLVIEQVKNSLGAFFSEYGCYPPVTNINYTQLDDTSLLIKYPSVTNWDVSTGLVYYLKYDNNAVKWKHYMDSVPKSQESPGYKTTWYNGGQLLYYTNNTETIKDGFGNPINYVPANGYQGYKLWSNGRNRKDESGANDDIGVTTGE